MTILDDGSRVTDGADEFVFVEVTEAMSLPSNLRILAITERISSSAPAGVTDVCPSNASYLIRFDPDDCDHAALLRLIADAHHEFADVGSVKIDTEIVEMPVYYDDPWTREVVMRFRDRHQSATETDLEYSARVNGMTVPEFVAAHCAHPWIATFLCFVPGNAECFQLVPPDRQIELPKYVRPRTDTPARAIGHGGAFTTIYPAQGAGGYQLLGRAATPVMDPSQTLPDFRDDMVLPRNGMLFQYRAVDADEYAAIRVDVEAGSYRYRRSPVAFELARFLDNPLAYNAVLQEKLRHA